MAALVQAVVVAAAWADLDQVGQGVATEAGAAALVEVTEAA